MLLDWFETTELYLAQNLVLLCSGKNGVVRVEAEEPEKIADLLTRIDAELRLRNQKLSGRLRVLLSTGLAPVIPFNAPPEVRQWGERLAVLKATAQQKGMDGQENGVIQLEAGGALLGASLTQSNADALAWWAQQHGLRLQSIQPLWAVASTAPALQTKSCKGLQLHEPDGILLLVEKDGHWEQFYQGVSIQESTRASVLRRLRAGLGVQEQDVMTLNFGRTSEASDRTLPKAWNSHWSHA